MSIQNTIDIDTNPMASEEAPATSTSASKLKSTSAPAKSDPNAAPCFDCIKAGELIKQQNTIIDDQAKKLNRMQAKLHKLQAFIDNASSGGRGVSKEVQRCIEEKDIIFAMRNAKKKHSFKSIAALYSVSDMTIRRIIRGEI